MREDEATKTCTRCLCVKPLGAFNKAPRYAMGVRVASTRADDDPRGTDERHLLQRAAGITRLAYRKALSAEPTDSYNSVAASLSCAVDRLRNGNVDVAGAMVADASLRLIALLEEDGVTNSPGLDVPTNVWGALLSSVPCSINQPDQP